jgi:hypothetical protein
VLLAALSAQPFIRHRSPTRPRVLLLWHRCREIISVENCGWRAMQPGNVPDTKWMISAFCSPDGRWRRVEEEALGMRRGCHSAKNLGVLSS